MSLLSDEELWALVPNADNLESARAIEAALMAKLASAELPEPFYAISEMGKKVPYFTADQLRQTYAQGGSKPACGEA